MIFIGLKVGFIMEAKVATEQALRNFIDRLIPQYQVYGPKKKKDQHAFDELISSNEADLHYPTTILPPKKFLIPPYEVLLTLKNDGASIPQNLVFPKKLLIFGIHPCDLNGILFLDKVFMDKFPSENYKKRRENLVLVALGCSEVSDTCFCSSLGTGPSIKSGFDLLLTPLREGYLVESGSKEGDKLITQIEGEAALAQDFSNKEQQIEVAKKKFKRSIKVDNLSEIFENNLNHEIWQRLGDIDLACGQCINSCPTCYCFDVRDNLSIDLKECSRYKEWDACLLLEFSEVALGGNFRRDRAARIRQFMGHNLGWGGAAQYPDANVQFKCVGCGRCIRTCPVHIDITEVVAELRGEKHTKSV